MVVSVDVAAVIPAAESHGFAIAKRFGNQRPGLRHRVSVYFSAFIRLSCIAIGWSDCSMYTCLHHCGLFERTRWNEQLQTKI